MVYRLPDAFYQGSVAGKILNTWQMSSIIQVTSGQPFTPGLTTNRSRSGVLGGPSGLDRPDLVAGVKLADVTTGTSRGCGSIAAGTPVGTAQLWFDPCAFAILAAGRDRKRATEALRGPGYSRVDLSFAKLIGTQTTNVELRVDIFNLLNTVNLGSPSRNVYAARANVEDPLPTAGQITTTAGPARMHSEIVLF